MLKDRIRNNINLEDYQDNGSDDNSNFKFIGIKVKTIYNLNNWDSQTAVDQDENWLERRIILEWLWKIREAKPTLPTTSDEDSPFPLPVQWESRR